MENVVSLNKPFALNDTTNKKYVLIDENKYNELLIAQDELKIRKILEETEEEYKNGKTYTHEQMKEFFNIK